MIKNAKYTVTSKISLLFLSLSSLNVYKTFLYSMCEVQKYHFYHNSEEKMMACNFQTSHTHTQF